MDTNLANKSLYLQEALSSLQLHDLHPADHPGHGRQPLALPQDGVQAGGVVCVAGIDVQGLEEENQRIRQGTVLPACSEIELTSAD